MSFNSVYSGHPFPNFSQSPHFFIAGLHSNWHPSAARGLSAVTSNGLDVMDYAMGYKLVRRALAFFQHFCSRPGFRPPSLHFFLGPSFSEKSLSPNFSSPSQRPSLIFGKYLAGLFSNFRRLRKLTRFLNLLFPPRAVFLIDTKRANSAANELSRLSLPLGALCGSSVDPLFIPYPVLSNYSVRSMSFFFKLFFSAAISTSLSSNLSALLKFVSTGPRYRQITDSPKVFGPTVKPAVQSSFFRFIEQFNIFFSQRLKKSFFGRRKYNRYSFRFPSRFSLVSKHRIPRVNSHWHHFKRLTSPEFRIFVGIRFSYFLKNPLFFWSYAENIFRGYNPHVSYEDVEDLRLFISPNRLRALYSVYERLRPLFFLITIMSYVLQAAPRPRFFDRSSFFKGRFYNNFYAMLVRGSRIPSKRKRKYLNFFYRDLLAAHSKSPKSPQRRGQQKQPAKLSPSSVSVSKKAFSRKILIYYSF